MKCQICKEAEATIHIHEIVNGKQTIIHICEKCANLKNGEIDDPLNMAELLCNAAESLQKNETQVCPHCGWPLSRFRKQSRLGCAHCWEAFKDVLVDGLASIHRGSAHVGLRPKDGASILASQPLENKEAASKKDDAVRLKIEALQKELTQAVGAENYELAAQLRDQINSLKKEWESL